MTFAAAKHYAETLSWPVFPCHPETKRPLTSHGFKDATLDVNQIEAWGKQFPDAAIGVPTGPDTAFVIDLDSEDAETALGDLQGEHGELPETIEAKTPRGRHLYFAYPDKVIKQSAGKLGPGILPLP